MNPQVTRYLTEAPRWRKEMERLRKIALGCELGEELKWGKPCYTFDGRNVVLIVGFKEYCALLFAKGVLLKDPEKILIKPGEHSQAARQIRFTGLEQIVELEPVLKAYLNQAIDAEKAGLDVKFRKPGDFVLPDELRRKLKERPELKAAFQALTPGRQRGYVLFFSAAKQSKTREARIGKCIPEILKGRGLYDEFAGRRRR